MEKSKFIGFILSFIPGLAHLYIGFKERGFIFLGMLGAGFVATVLMEVIFYSGGQFFILFLMGYALLWLIALLDLFSAWKLIGRRYSENINIIRENQEMPFFTKEEIQIKNKRSLTLALSIVPGAGHMYLGYQKKGLLIMGTFFFSIFFMGWLRISMLLFLLPLIWFYGFFDAMHIAEGTKEIISEQELELPKIKPQWIGYGLVSIGLIIIIERILYPLIDYQIRSFLQTSIVSIIFIVIGLMILKNNKKDNEEGTNYIEEDGLTSEDDEN